MALNRTRNFIPSPGFYRRQYRSLCWILIIAQLALMAMFIKIIKTQLNLQYPQYFISTIDGKMVKANFYLDASSAKNKASALWPTQNTTPTVSAVKDPSPINLDLSNKEQNSATSPASNSTTLQPS